VQTQSFQIIPVIDLMHGQVVHAKLGQRHDYQPIKSQLCESSNALDIVTALMKLYPFRTLYIADIDAILGTGNHDELIEKIHFNFPSLHLWLDAGNYRTSAKAFPVLGSESFSSLENYLQHKNPHVLSLDYNANGAMGIADLHESAEYWPDAVICMTLNQVGSAQGFDYKRLNALISRNKTSKIYAAGGVRGVEDLTQLKKIGVSGALVASALHHGELSAQQLALFN
jgi:phosphoribosylformimino-5-aminoimidazole carboxamide ribotide isomerase